MPFSSWNTGSLNVNRFLWGDKRVLWPNNLKNGKLKCTNFFAVELSKAFHMLGCLLESIREREENDMLLKLT